MEASDALTAHRRARQRITAVATDAAARLWERVNVWSLDRSYARIEPELVALTTAAQTAAARSGADAMSRILYETEQIDLPAGDVIPSAFAGTASDGRPLDGLLRSSLVRTKEAIGAAWTLEQAMVSGGAWLTMLIATQVSDASREASQAAIGARPHVDGFVRVLNMPSCSRCIILAGKWFRWNEGFQRHPGCDCSHEPSSKVASGEFVTDPYEAFNSMSKAEQDRAFGRIEARAVRDGADIYRVVNLRRRGLATARGARRFGTPSRMTLDDIYRTAGTRTNAIRMMTEQGYITGPQVAGGNVIGVREGFGQMGRGGTRVGASRAVLEARRTGMRDPLNRTTMTAAERRVNDAHTMMQTVQQGRNPWLKGRPLTAEDRALAERIYQKQIADLPNQPPQVLELARLLGMV